MEFTIALQMRRKTLRLVALIELYVHARSGKERSVERGKHCIVFFGKSVRQMATVIL